MSGPQSARTPLQEAIARKRRAVPAYERAIRVLPAAQHDPIRDYVAALHAEAAAHRNEASRLRAVIDGARARGLHPNQNGERP